VVENVEIDKLPQKGAFRVDGQKFLFEVADLAAPK
jgi:hypothetical protein